LSSPPPHRPPPLSLHDALPILTADNPAALFHRPADVDFGRRLGEREVARPHAEHDVVALEEGLEERFERPLEVAERDRAVDHQPDRKSTRLNSSHRTISYAVFC